MEDSLQIKQQINKIKELLAPIFSKYQINKAGLFGSAIKMPIESAHDVDIIFEKNPIYHIGNTALFMMN